MDNDKLLVQGSPPVPLERELGVVGRPLDRMDGYEKVTGAAMYAGDIRLPGMLYGKILHCPHPRARIAKIDISKAQELPGVKAVLTKDNTQGWRTHWYDISEPAFPEVLTREGQEVAAVAAVDAPTARRAAELIDVEYEILPPMPEAGKVLAAEPFPPTADEEYPERELYDRKPFIIKRGDIEKGFDEADVVIESVYRTPTQYHATIETRACVASWENGVLTVWDAAQGVWNSKAAFAESFGLDPANVRVIVKYLGGGFGSKAWSQRMSYYAARLAMVTGSPVRMERTRSEEFLSHPHRYDCEIRLKIGAKKDGRLTAVRERAVLNIGAATGAYSPNRIIWQTSNLYECPNVFLEQIGVFSNRGTTGPTRAPFNMPGNFPLEVHMDKLAAALGIDPLEMRMKNYKTHASTHVKPKFDGQDLQIPWSAKRLDECMRKVADAIGWEGRPASKDSSRGPKKRGVGMAAFVAHQGGGGKAPNKAYADVDIKHDGTITLHIGVVDIGGGQRTIFAMIAAETLGVLPEMIRVDYGDTENTRYGPSCHTSRVTAELGPPVLQAAAEGRQKLFALAAPLLGSAAEKLESGNGVIYVKDEPGRSLPFREACRLIDPSDPLRGSGSREVNPDSPLFSSFGAQAAEVEVDIETGEVTLLRMAAAQDFGRAINPKLCLSQIVGGIEFGVGYALYEEGLYDKRTGKMLNTNLHQYRLPMSTDMPRINAFLVGGPDPYFAFDARGGAEVTNTPAPAAIANAIFNAAGVWCDELPITPDKIIGAVRARRDKG